MKRNSLILLVVAASLMFSTKASAQWEAGGGIASFSHKGSDRVLKENIPGFYFGASYNLFFSPLEGLSFEPGAYIIHYGKTFTYIDGLAEKAYRANYIHIPLNIKYTYEVGDDLSLGVFTGPRFNTGLGGNMFSKGETFPALRWMDAQWGLGIALTYAEAVQLRLGYDYGLTRAVRDRGGNKNQKVHRNSILFGVAFLF